MTADERRELTRVLKAKKAAWESAAYARGEAAVRAEFDAMLARFRALKELNGTGEIFKAAWDESGDRRKPAPPVGKALISVEDLLPLEDEPAPEPTADPDPHPHDALLEALLAVREELDGDPHLPAALEWLRGQIGDGGGETVGKAQWDESLHPRGKGGHFISKDRLQEAKTDPKVADELRAEVKPEDAHKLEKVISGESDPGRTRRGQQRHEAAGRRETREQSRQRADELIHRIHAGVHREGGVTADDLHALADHLPEMRVEDIRRARLALSAAKVEAGFGGARRKLEMVAGLVAGAKKHAAAMAAAGGQDAPVQVEPGADPDPLGGEGAAPESAPVAPAAPPGLGEDWEKQHREFMRPVIEDRHRAEIRDEFHDSPEMDRVARQLEKDNPEYRKLLGRLGKMSETEVDDESHPVNRRMRELEVRAALAAGKPVPPEVLADYPDLRPAPQDAPVQVDAPDPLGGEAPAPAPEPDGGSGPLTDVPGEGESEPEAAIEVPGEATAAAEEPPDPTQTPTTPVAVATQQAEEAGETPRGVAEAASTAGTPDYEFARQSAVGNAGEDLKGSARHTRNAWRGLEQAEKDGTAKELVKRDHLLKNEPHALMATMESHTALEHLAAHLAVNAFPAEPGDYPAAYDRYRTRDGGTPHRTPPEELRKQYHEAYQSVKAVAEKAATTATNPRDVLRAVAEEAKRLIRKYRAVPESATGYELASGYSAKDPYNPVANALVDLQNRAGGSGAKATHLAARMNDFAKRVKEKYGDITPGNMEKVGEHVADVMEGDSFNKTFGTKKEGGGQFSPADAYVNHVTRKGGRVIDAATVQAGTDFIMKNLGMRGLQWGNSVTDDERQHHLTKTAEAMADLADVTGLPDAAMSLGGVLGFAIGARGKGKAMAHYEPSTKVINLTRKKGAGTIAHEWGHALDHHIAGGGLTENMGKKQADYLSRDPRDHGGDPVKMAMGEVRKAMDASGFEARARQVFFDLQRAGQIPHSQNWRDYWGSHHEKFARAFEKHVKHKLLSEGRENTYLSGIADHGLWPTAEESAHMAPAMDALLAAVRGKHFDAPAQKAIRKPRRKKT